MADTHDSYDGAVVYREGVHYAVDDDGHADLSRPLRWVEGSTYRAATDGEPLHAEVHQANDVVIYPGQQVVYPPGQDSYPVGAHVVSYEAGVYYLLDDATGTVHDDHPLAWASETQTFVAAS